MKVVHVCNTDIKGGAARAAYAINFALKQIGVDSKMLVQRKFSNNPDVYSVSEGTLNKQLTNYRMILDLIPMNLFTKKEKGRFSFGKTGVNIASYPVIRDADIIHLHWINEGFLSLNNIKRLGELGKPIVWTFHDMWAFTGGCHYSAGCERYKNTCKCCPYLKNPQEKDFSTNIQSMKQNSYKDLNLHIVTCSKWLFSCSVSSPLMKNIPSTVIPNPIDVNKFKPKEKIVAQKRLGLHTDKKFILFGTMSLNENRKGFKILKDALIKYSRNNAHSKNTELVIFGSPTDEMNDIPLKINFLGRISDEQKLVDAYCSADVFVAPSLEDNLPNTVMESLAAGTPVVAFNIGGMPDMIEHQKNGYLAEPFSIDDFINGIEYVINRRDGLSHYAREKVTESFTPEIISKKYIELYNSFLT